MLYNKLTWTGLMLASAAAYGQTRTPDPTFKNSSEAGVIITSGNARARSYNVKQTNTYDVDNSTIKFNGQFLRTESYNVETVRWWNAGLRYQYHFIPSSLGLYAGESVESNKYSGYDYRYHTDVGATFTALKQDDFWWVFEVGYRYTIEDPVLPGDNLKSHYGRVYTEVFKDWTPNLSATVNVEYLPNFSHTNYWQLNGEAGLNFFLTEVFSAKIGYLVKYNHSPIAPATEKTDSFFTTALVAKF